MLDSHTFHPGTDPAQTLWTYSSLLSLTSDRVAAPHLVPLSIQSGTFTPFTGPEAYVHLVLGARLWLWLTVRG